MSIWEYKGSVKDKDLIERGLALYNCLFCNTRLITLHNEMKGGGWQRHMGHVFSNIEELHTNICPSCGWWNAKRVVTSLNDRMTTTIHYGGVGTLRDLDLLDLSTPIHEIRNFLMAKYQARFEIHPRLFEETVASVFGDLGYKTKVTAYSGDGGIDVILEGSGGIEIGVQVKRYKHSIAVEQIRSFTGALVLGGCTKGIFITTSNYQSGVYKVIERAALKGIQIEVMNADKFLDALKIAQRNNYKTQEEFLEQFDFNGLVSLKQWDGPSMIMLGA